MPEGSEGGRCCLASRREAMERVIRLMGELAFCTRRYRHVPAIRLARKLAELACRRMNKVLFAPEATSTVRSALKLARAATGRVKTISSGDSFHGDTLEAISVGGWRGAVPAGNEAPAAGGAARASAGCGALSDWRRA